MGEDAESRNKHRACHGWSGCNCRCPVSLKHMYIVQYICTVGQKTQTYAVASAKVATVYVFIRMLKLYLQQWRDSWRRKDHVGEAISWTAPAWWLVLRRIIFAVRRPNEKERKGRTSTGAFVWDFSRILANLLQFFIHFYKYGEKQTFIRLSKNVKMRFYKFARTV